MKKVWKQGFWQNVTAQWQPNGAKRRGKMQPMLFAKCDSQMLLAKRDIQMRLRMRVDKTAEDDDYDNDEYKATARTTKQQLQGPEPTMTTTAGEEEI